MKKQNIAILCLAPFVIALFGIAAIRTTFSLTAQDISRIDWDYNDDEEPFKISDNLYHLKAKAVSNSKYALAEGNNLVWSVTNLNPDDETVYAEISLDSQGEFYLHAIEEGIVNLTCSNEKGNIYRSTHAVIYKDSVIIINGEVPSSGTSISPKTYFGEYDLDEFENKKEASFNYTIKAFPEYLQGTLFLKESSSNISFDLSSGHMSITAPGKDSYFTIGGNPSLIDDKKVQFDVIENGINVYDYDDLTYCTNRSEEGEIVVLRKSLLPKDNALVKNSDGSYQKVDGKYVTRAKNIDVFGHFNESLVVEDKNPGFNFKDEVYTHQTTYNTDYIDQWNSFCASHTGYTRISKNLYSALHVQKDIYGNGYTLDFHDLIYPYSKISITSSDGKVISTPSLSGDNLFRGPLPYYAIGDPGKLTLVEVFGQDNSGIYIDGDDITLDDLEIKNADFDGSMSFLSTCGSAIDVHGDNVTIKNSRISNAKNLIRAYSSDLNIENSLLSYASNFLLYVGSEKYDRMSDSKNYEFTLMNGNKASYKLSDYLKKSGPADNLVGTYMNSAYADEYNQKIINACRSLQANMDEGASREFDAEINIKDTFFYKSGIASIGIDTYFNGPYLYSSIPSSISGLIGNITIEGGTAVPYLATKVGARGSPVKIKASGMTRFYDYKTKDEMDLSGLIGENLSTVAKSMLGDDTRDITVDDIFPMKNLLRSKASKESCVYSNNMNIPVAFYGGGVNYSEVDLSEIEHSASYTDPIDIDLLSEYIGYKGATSMAGMFKNMAVKLVNIASGFNPFRFTLAKNDGYLYGETPKASELIANAKKGESI